MTTARYDLVVGSLDVSDRHVDDAVFPRYVRRVRERFFREHVGDTFQDYGRPVVHLELDFRSELFAGDRFDAVVRLLEVGDTSVTTEVELTSDGDTVATAETVQVVVDLESGRTVSVPEAWRAGLDA